MKMGGWLTRSMFDRYNIVDENDQREALAKIEAQRKVEQSDCLKKPYSAENDKKTAGGPIQ